MPSPKEKYPELPEIVFGDAGDLFERLTEPEEIDYDNDKPDLELPIN